MTRGARWRVALVGVAGFAFFLVLATWPTRALAYDFSLDLRTVGQGYQVRGFAPGGGSAGALSVAVAATLVLGVFPQPVLDLANHAVPFLR